MKPLCFSLIAYILFKTLILGNLVMTISGTNGSNSIDYRFSGSVTVSSDHSVTNNVMSFPSGINDGWIRSYDAVVGDYWAAPDWATFAFDAADIDVFVNGNPLSQADWANNNGGDFNKFYFRNDGTIWLRSSDTEPDYTLSAGDVLSWSGSGTFVGNYTFDNMFNLGTYEAAIDGGFFRVEIVNAANLPKPSPWRWWEEAEAWVYIPDEREEIKGGWTYIPVIE